MSVLVELCCGGIDDLLTAQHCGADRAELCSALSLSGLTPSMGTFLYAREQADIPIVVMIRPRSNGFCYSDEEFAVMLRDTRLFISQGADSITFGCLTPQGLLDRERCLRMREAAKDATLVFHRAFDVVPRPLEALEQLIEMGMNRVLTSGNQTTALEGADRIAQLVQAAAGRIEITGGGGVRAENLAQLITQTGLTQVHLSASSLYVDTSTDGNKAILFDKDSSYNNRYSAADPEKLKATIAVARGI